MIFRRKSAHEPVVPPRPVTLAERLQALGILLQERRYVESGLCILANAEGFVVTGYALPEGSGNISLTQQTVELDAGAIAAAVEQLRRQDQEG